MIIVVEGISASGKSSWCARHAPGHCVPETGRLVPPPGSAAAQATFWAGQNARRWQAALETEQASGAAICDTDPLKLHYTWGLWQLGVAPEAQWQQELALARQQFTEKRIGFADAYFVKDIDPVVARWQRDGDATRSRRNFELHLRLQPALLVWYAALAAVLPGRVQFDFPAGWVVPPRPGPPHPGRYDLARFDQAMALLPTSLAQ